MKTIQYILIVVIFSITCNTINAQKLIGFNLDAGYGNASKVNQEVMFVNIGMVNVGTSKLRWELSVDLGKTSTEHTYFKWRIQPEYVFRIARFQPYIAADVGSGGAFTQTEDDPNSWGQFFVSPTLGFTIWAGQKVAFDLALKDDIGNGIHFIHERFGIKIYHRPLSDIM